MGKIIRFALVLLTLSLGGLSPSLAATSGLDFLKVGVGARPIALGEAYVALADDINAIYWNPAGLVQVKIPEVGFTYNKWFEDIGYHFLGYSHPLDNSILGVSAYYLGAGDIDGSDNAGNPIGEFTTYDLAFAFSYGRRLSERVSVGANFKYILEKLEEELASAFAFDIGALYKPGVYDLVLGVNIQNIGTGIKFVEESASLPQNVKFGLAYTLFPENPLILTLDFNKCKDKGVYVGSGAEFWVVDYLALRIGGKFDPDVKDGLRLGFGLRAGNFGLDYAYTPHRILGDTHQFSFSLYLGKLAPEEIISRKEIEQRMVSVIASLREEGMVYLEQERYIEAIAKFSEILLLDPEDKEAISTIKEANRLLMERE